MQHIDTPGHPLDTYGAVWRTAKPLSLALAGLIAFYEYSPGLLIVLAIAVAMVFALAERARKLQAVPPPDSQALASRPLGDGGSFPGSGPETVPEDSAAPRVLDGGSL